MPRAWAGVDSETLRRWLADFLRHPNPNLPADPGPGERRVSFSLPKRQVKVASGLLDETESAALRRIVAARMGSLPPAHSPFWLPAVRGAELLPSSVSLPHTVASPRGSVPVLPRYRRADLEGWVPARSLDRTAVPFSQARFPLPLESNNILPESPGLLEVAICIGIAVLVVWVFLWLFREAPTVR